MTMACSLRVALLLLVHFAEAADSPSAAVCSSEHASDSSTAGCFGWCSPAYQADHCTYCKCKGCAFCKDGAAAPAAAVAASASTAVDTAAQCSSDNPGDASYKDCQPFCTAAYANDHCPLCKCKACGFCKCTSAFEDDSDEEQCQDWCDEAFFEDHCGRCKCKGCKFCRQGARRADREECFSFRHTSHAAAHQ